MTILFENVPLPHLLLVPKYQMCRTMSLGVVVENVAKTVVIDL